MLLKLSHAHKSHGDLVKMWVLIQQAWLGSDIPHFWQVPRWTMLLVWEPHLELQARVWLTSCMILRFSFSRPIYWEGSSTQEPFHSIFAWFQLRLFIGSQICISWPWFYILDLRGLGVNRHTHASPSHFGCPVFSHVSFLQAEHLSVTCSPNGRRYEGSGEGRRWGSVSPSSSIWTLVSVISSSMSACPGKVIKSSQC